MRIIPNLSVNIGSLKLNNPVIVASGTFGYAEEFKDFVNLERLGAIVTKTVTLNPRMGNPVPRTCETPAGMLNSIGLENPGIDRFIDEKLPPFKKIGASVIVSIASEANTREFVDLAERLDEIKEVAGIELNISCPNISSRLSRLGYRRKSSLISQDNKATYNLVKSVRKVTKKTIITKLSPNVTSISDIALAAESAGSDAVSLINTLGGMAIDIGKRQPKIACGFGGLSGPAIRPVAVRMVREVYEKIKVPIIGMGGIMDVSSALEFIIAGATAVGVGTANFVDPAVSIEIIDGIKEYLANNKMRSIKELIGSLIV